MVKRVLQPQEVEVFYVLPALRREIAHAMKLKGKSQKEIASLLGITEPAVSQYFSSKRANHMDFDSKVSASIRDASARIVDQQSLVRETQGLLRMLRAERVICRMHASLGQVPTNCNLCFEHETKEVNVKGPF